MKQLTSISLASTCAICFVVLLLVISSSTAVQAQRDTTQVNAKLILGKRVIIVTTDGSTIQGMFMGHTEGGIRIATESAGEIIVSNSRINSLKVIEDDRIKNGEYWFENPNATRYLFSPSAYSLKKGEAYYQNTYLLVNSINYGVTDNFTIGGGFELISTFTGNPIFFITPKYSFKINEKVRAGAGVLYATVISSDFGVLGIGYGILTYGTSDDNVTLGAGYGYVDNGIANKPVLTLSGMKRISRRIGLVSENWLIPADNYYGLFSYGIRFMSEKITVDFAFLNNSDIASTIFIGMPYIDFAVKFGK
jgi:hypothetical protein